MNRKRVLRVVFISVICTGLILWLSGLLSLWLKGIHVIANDVDGYHLETHPIEGEYSVSIDLSDLKSNEGKVLYDDGENRIYVKAVIKNIRSKYQIEFRSSGTYGINGATLVSGIEHVRANNGFTNHVRVNAFATYQGKRYKINPSLRGFTYKDGDFLGFYLTPQDIDLEIDPSKDAKMVLTFSNLYKHVWEKR